MQLIENQWYIGCASSQLSREQPLGTRIGPHKIVLFRDQDGVARALLDRCCHRGFPLSCGKLRDGRLQCLYHGWEYDANGRCIRIPSFDEGQRIPRRFAIPRFRCLEQDSFVWIWIGNEPPAALAGAPEVATGYWSQGQRTIRCNYVRALENAVDECHVCYVHPMHPATIRAGKLGMAVTSYELRATRDGCVLFTPPTTSELEPEPAVLFEVRFWLPGVVRFKIAAEPGFFYMYFWVTPLADDLCRMHWLVSSVPRKDRIKWVGEESGPIGVEDATVLERIQPTYEEEGEGFECTVQSDLPPLTVRRMIRAAERGEFTPEILRGVTRLVLRWVSPRRDLAPEPVGKSEARHFGRGDERECGAPIGASDPETALTT